MNKFLIGLTAAAVIATPLAVTATAAAATNTADVITADAAVGSTTVTFTNSKGEPLAGGEAWAVAGTWIPLGTTGPSGSVSALLAPGSYEFTMDYLGVRQSQTVHVGDGGAQVAFKTASATVTFKNSKGQPLAGGDAWAVAGKWLPVGTTGETGSVSTELPYGSYEFTMDYLGVRQSQTVHVGDGGAQVEFKTASATVTFKNTRGEPRAGGNAWVMAPGGTWTELGNTGLTAPLSIELAPGSYEFTMDYGGTRQSKRILVDADTAVVFDSPTTVTFTNSQGQPLKGGNAWVVAPAGNWIELGTTGSDGALSADLPYGTYEFTMDYLGLRQSQTVLVDDDGAQVAFKTASATVTFTDSKGKPLKGGDAWAVSAGKWIPVGTTGETGTVSAELPYGTYEFTMDYLGVRQSQTKLVDDGGAQVAFKTASAAVTFTDSKGKPLAGGDAWAVSAGKWIPVGTTGETGTVSAELPYGTYEFTMDYGGARQSQTKLVGGGAQVAFNTYRVEVRGQVTNAAGAKSPVLGGTWWYIAPDGNWRTIGTPDLQGDAITQLLPGTYTFVHVAADDTRHEFPNVTISANGRKVLPFVG